MLCGYHRGQRSHQIPRLRVVDDSKVPHKYAGN